MIRNFLSLIVLISAAPSLLYAEKNENDLVHKANEVQGRLELTGRFDSSWAEEELHREIGAHCERRGKTLVQFKTTGVDKQLGTSFVATCQ